MFTPTPIRMPKIAAYLARFATRAALAFGLGVAGVSVAHADVINITASGFSFTPSIVTVHPGDTVRFNLTTCCHSVDQAADGSTCTPMVGGFSTHGCGIVSTFDVPIPANAGASTLFFLCQCHCVFGMKGKINIVPVCNGASVTTDPHPTMTCRGGDASFTVVAAGTGPLTYSWRHDNTPIPNTNSPTLNLTAVHVTAAGQYDCVVTNACGTATSGAAHLTVCASDFNCDGFVDFFDFDDFVTAFENGDASADFNDDGFIDFFDFDDFVTAFEQGC